MPGTCQIRLLCGQDKRGGNVIVSKGGGFWPVSARLLCLGFSYFSACASLCTKLFSSHDSPPRACRAQQRHLRNKQMWGGGGCSWWWPRGHYHHGQYLGFCCMVNVQAYRCINDKMKHLKVFDQNMAFISSTLITSEWTQSWALTLPAPAGCPAWLWELFQWFLQKLSLCRGCFSAQVTGGLRGSDFGASRGSQLFWVLQWGWSIEKEMWTLLYFSDWTNPQEHKISACYADCLYLNYSFQSKLLQLHWWLQESLCQHQPGHCWTIC